MQRYFRPIVHNDPAHSRLSLPLCGTGLWFDQVECLQRGKASSVLPASEVPAEILDNLTRPRPTIGAMDFSAPNLMGVLNVTPDSFSDGGVHNVENDAIKRAKQMIEMGVDIVDIGGESTRPGADCVNVDEEISRTVGVIEKIREIDREVVISIDTRKAPVATAAINAGATMLNDVSALSFDPCMAGVAARNELPICLMHAQGDPAVMQDDPNYSNVLLDVFDYLAERVCAAVAAGIDRSRIIIDPGVGFGKTLEHNLSLIRRISLFHAIGCPILLGVSRKRFIGTISGELTPAKRGAGSLAVALEGVRQGVQIVRAHDINTHRQAFALWTELHKFR